MKGHYLYRCFWIQREVVDNDVESNDNNNSSNNSLAPQLSDNNNNNILGDSIAQESVVSLADAEDDEEEEEVENQYPSFINSNDHLSLELGNEEEEEEEEEEEHHQPRLQRWATCPNFRVSEDAGAEEEEQDEEEQDQTNSAVGVLNNDSFVTADEAFLSLSPSDTSLSLSVSDPMVMSTKV